MRPPHPTAPPLTLDGLEEACEAARRTSGDSCFLTEAWLRATALSWAGVADARLVRLTRTGDGDAWALLGRRTVVRHRVLPVRVLALGQAIDPVLDQPWVERNGFFGAAPCTFALDLDALLDRLDGEADWDELRLPGIEAAHRDDVARLADRRGLRLRVELDVATFAVDLDAIRASGAGWIASRSANTRQQLRRAARATEQRYGPLRVEVAATADEAHRYLEATAPLHLERWGRAAPREGGSGFANPAFVAFHYGLIDAAFEHGGIHYLRVAAGERTLGYLYTLVAGRRVHFYLSGIDRSVGDEHRPGLLAHWLAIEHALSLGFTMYDLLAGDARYKRSLANVEGRMLWLVLERPRLRLRAEDAARRLRRALTRRRMVEPSG